MGIELTTSRVLLHRHVPYHCATTAAPKANYLLYTIILSETFFVKILKNYNGSAAILVVDKGYLI